VLYQNNVDNKGASYGSHENYLMRRNVPFTQIVEHLTPFFVSRQIVAGAGRVGLRQDGSKDGFQISQRADYFEVGVGLETTLKRPIINTRDEPHSDPSKYRRLHVIIGDANCSETSIYLKMGTTALVLDMIEAGYLPGGLTLDRPVTALHHISHDASLRVAVEREDGRTITALELQGEYLTHAQQYVDREGGDEQTKDVLERWASVLERLEQDPMLCKEELDWVAKLSLLESYRERDGIDWDHPKLQLIDLQYHDIRPEKGLYHRLVRAGRMQRLFTHEEILRAVQEPPTDTRAYFRGMCLTKYAADIAAASWDSVIFDLPGHSSLQRVPTVEPLRGTKEHVGALFEQHDTAQGLFTAITSR
ncbi:MAG: proteasome accessory factor PafA2, partial [Nocardioidaceae bacterium]|nr:proteasome accessory factor PafA2 [Nocardioidaceae bacterium]